MTKIAISYRRHDSDAITGRIFDRLVAHYGADSVFRDIDNIPPGLDFRKYIGLALESTDIVLAIVGPQWAGKSADGRSRIKEATDLVRIEVELALRRDIPVVPVLVGNATMPEPGELPEGLQDFSFRNAVKVDALEDFEDHVKRLIRSLDRLIQPRATSPPTPAPPSVAATPAPASAGRAEPSPERQAQVAPPSGGTTEPVPTARPAAKTESRERPTDPQSATAPPPPVAGRSLLTSPALTLPALAAAVYLVLWATGLWTSIQMGIYSPVPPVALGALLGFAFWRYGRASATRSLLAFGILWVGASFIGLAYSSLSPSITGVEARQAWFAVDVLAASVLVLAVGAALCPALRWPPYWAIGLVLWPGLALASSWVVQQAAQGGGLDRSAIGAVAFATYIVRQMIVFGCIGYWLSQGGRPAKA